jgi:transcriptional regulator with XRE-family HTH domain
MAKKPKATTQPTELPEVPEEGGIEVPEDGIGGRIRATREARGWSQTDVSNMSKELDPARKGVSRTVLVGYEAGQFRPGAREIRILCETLNVTPNWLIYGDDDFAGGTAQTSMEAMRKNGLFAAVRLALAICVMRPHERNALQSLALSMAGRELGDRKLSILFLMASAITQPGFEVLAKDLEMPPEELMALDVGAAVKRMLAKHNDSNINWGNKLNYGPEGKGPITGEWLYPEPKE